MTLLNTRHADFWKPPVTMSPNPAPAGRLALFACLFACFFVASSAASASESESPPWQPPALLATKCGGCHNAETSEGNLDLGAMPRDLASASVRDRWIQIHDRIEHGEMPPDSGELAAHDRKQLLQELGDRLRAADQAEITAIGRGPMRRLNRDEFEQNLRDVLRLPQLDIRDMLPEDREGHRFHKTTATLDLSRIQLAAFLEATGVALRQARATGSQPLPVTKYRAQGTRLFSARETFGEREAMFFALDNRVVQGSELDPLRDSPKIELALFRSAHWPYYGYPQDFVAAVSGEYRVRFSARAVVQERGYVLKPAQQPVPMTFRARKPSGPDVSGDVRATGGCHDIQPAAQVFETTILLREGETFEYSLLGLPVPLARNVDGGPPTYRYPPFPDGGQPGVAFQWLEVEGPIPPESWPPPSHRVLFDQLGPDDLPSQSGDEARRLLRRFVTHAAREPVSDEELLQFERLVRSRLEQGIAFADALLAGYQAFLCSSHFLYLREPEQSDDHYAIAARLSHFLANTRPDSPLIELAGAGRLRDADTLRLQVERLIAAPSFDRFVQRFTDDWLSLRHLRRDEPDIRLYPEYRFDDYLVESMGHETHAFFAAMIRDNLSARVLVEADFVFANDRLAQHYQLPPLQGSSLRRVSLPPGSPLGGLLTQAAIMKVTANGTSTSPVVRGAWVMERILGQPPPTPPASVPAVEPDIRGAKTIRELLASHTKSPTCAACHARFDPLGLALENFDIFGAWRTKYRGVEHGERVTGIDRAGHDFAYTLAEPIDASGQLRDGPRFRDIRELKSQLASQPRQLGRNLLHQFTVYSTGTPVRFADRAELEEILDRCSPDDYRVRDLLVALVQSRVFLGKDGSQ